MLNFKEVLSLYIPQQCRYACLVYTPYAISLKIEDKNCNICFCGISVPSFWELCFYDQLQLSHQVS